LKLETAYEYMFGENPTLQWHQADVDAWATAQIFKKVINDFRTGIWLPTKPGTPYRRINIVEEEK
jgi:hypothetical protein